MNQPGYVCPACKQPLARMEGRYDCSACGISYADSAGIPCFDTALITSPMPPVQETEELLAQCAAMPWRDALAQKLKKQRPFRYERLVYDKAADWMALLPLNGSSKILDAGCGWGTLTFQLAGNCEAVYAMDSSEYAARFVDLRRRQDGVGNVIPLRGSVLQLPFPDDHFDLVVLNGVLEWAGCADPASDPEDVQRRLLAEVCRVLKPGGHLYLAIENRYSATYFLGQTEGHVNLKFISLMPRFLASAYHRLRKRSPYCVYTHNLNTYVSLLKASGFAAVDAYAPIPQYQKFSHIIPINNVNAFKYYLQVLFAHTRPSAVLMRNIVNALHLYGLLKYVVPCYSFIAAKAALANPMDSLLKQHCAALSERGPAAESSRPFSYILSSARNNILLFPFRGSGTEPSCVVKICRNGLQPRPETRFRGRLPAEIKKGVPEVVYESSADGRCLSVEKSLRGRPLESLIQRHSHSPETLNRYFSRATDWLLAFQRATKSGEVTIDSKNVDRYFDPLFDAAETRAQDPADRGALSARLSALRSAVMGAKIPLTVQHRDFGPSNILISDDTVAVLDWELSKENGDPLYDLFYFITRFGFSAGADRARYPVCDFATTALFSGQIFFGDCHGLRGPIAAAAGMFCRAHGITPEVAAMLFLRQEIEKNGNLAALKLFFQNENRFIIPPAARDQGCPENHEHK